MSQALENLDKLVTIRKSKINVGKGVAGKGLNLVSAVGIFSNFWVTTDFHVSNSRVWKNLKNCIRWSCLCLITKPDKAV